MASYYQFGQLFNITFTNDHFSDHVLRAFTVEQAASDATFGASARWCPPDKSSFGCWYDFLKQPFDGTTLLKDFSGNLHWNFLFRITDPSFYDYTQLQPLPFVMDATKADQNGQVQLNYYFFANHDENLAVKKTNALTKNADVSASDALIGQQYYQDNDLATLVSSDNAPLALISIIWNSTVWNNNQQNIPDPSNNNKKIKKYKPPEYQVNFPERA